MKVLVTGHVGFIGFCTAMKFVQCSSSVIGLDVVSDHQDPTLKLEHGRISDKDPLARVLPQQRVSCAPCDFLIAVNTAS